MSRSEHEAWIHASLSNEDLINYKVTFTGTTEKGDGFASCITFFSVTGTTKTGEAKEINLAIKDDNRHKGVSEQLQLKLAFIREIEVYDKIFKTFEKFQSVRSITNPFVSYPKCYKTFILDKMEALVFQNMRKFDYKLRDLKQPFDSAHMNLLLREYGKLHALSFALRDLEPDTYKNLTENYEDIMRKLFKIEAISKTFTNVYYKNVEILKQQDEGELLEKYKEMEGEIMRMLTGIDYGSDPYAVIIHGDCWNNNFMFHYEDNIPDKVVLVDWQCSRLATPVFDLAYFYYSSVHEDKLDQFNEAIDVYYGSFSELLREFGCDASKLFPKSVLKDQWKKYCKIGLIYAPIIYQMACYDKENHMDNLEKVEDFEKFMDFKVDNPELLHKRIVKLIRHFVDNDFI